MRAIAGRWRRAVVAGGATCALLGLGAAGYVALRGQGVLRAETLVSRGLLPETGLVVVADFEDHAGDQGLVSALEQAFRVHLSQSPTVALASRALVDDVLERMHVEPGAGLGLDVAREAAIREGWRAVVAGELHSVGARYTLSVRVVAAESGAELAAWIETADRADDLIPAVERLSVRLREQVGESLASVRRSPPLSRVRTTSLAALRSYTEGARANGRGEFERCVLLMDAAIERDSMFAMAYAGRAGCLQNLGRDRALQISDRIRAFEMRDRMTEEERLRLTAVYHQFVTVDRVRAVGAWEAYAARYPGRTSALFSLANLYAEGREWDRAEQVLLRGLELDPDRSVVLLNLAGYQINRGRIAAAEATFRALEREMPGFDTGWWRASMRLAATDWEGAAAELAGARERARGNAIGRAHVAALESRLARTLGRFEEAATYAAEGAAAAREAGSVDDYHLHTFDLADLHLARGDTAAALGLVERALAAFPLDSLDPFARPYFALADLLARAGRPNRARAHLARWEAEVASLVPGSNVPHWLRAVLAEVEGRDEEAVKEWQLEDGERDDPLPALIGIGAAYDRMGHADSALAYYERFLETPSRKRYDSDPRWRGPVLERLGRLYEQRGEVELAVRRYRQFVTLWEEADPGLQPRVDAVRTRLRALEADGAGRGGVDADAAGRKDVTAPLLDEGRVGYGGAWR